MKAFISNIGRHRIFSDGNGITTLVIFQDCLLRCKYCINQYTWSMNKGKYMSCEELLDEVFKDHLYFTVSNGGITFGGGEPLLQANFIKEFCNIAPKKWKFYIETSLFAESENLISLFPYIDGYIVDVKDLNNSIYSSYTGYNNHILIKNLQILIKNVDSNKVKIRLPLIPGYNTERDVEISKKELENMGFSIFDIFNYSIEKSYKGANRRWVCDLLGKIRKETALQFHVPYHSEPCNHVGACKGTCWKCDKELKELTNILINKQIL